MSQLILKPSKKKRQELFAQGVELTQDLIEINFKPETLNEKDRQMLVHFPHYFDNGEIIVTPYSQINFSRKNDADQVDASTLDEALKLMRNMIKEKEQKIREQQKQNEKNETEKVFVDKLLEYVAELKEAYPEIDFRIPGLNDSNTHKFWYINASIQDDKLLNNNWVIAGDKDSKQYPSDFWKQIENEKEAIASRIEEKIAEKKKAEQKKQEREAELKALPEKVKTWIRKNGSELLRLREKYGFEFMHLAGVEHAKQIIKSNKIFEGFKVMNPDFYEDLFVADSDDEPSLEMLKELDALTEMNDEALKVSLEYKRCNGEIEWYLCVSLDVVSQVKIIIFKKF